jgi:hypothetical protein
MKEPEVKFEVYANPGAPSEIHLRQGGLPEPYQYRGYNYTLESIGSVIELIRWKGNNLSTVIFVDDGGVQVILDDAVINRPKDTAKYSYKKSIELDEWALVLSKAIQQKSFIDFLKRRPDDQVEEIDLLLASVQKMNLATVITGEYEPVDSNNVTVSFKIKETETSTKIPKVLIIQMPLVFGSDNIVTMEVELEFRAPRNEGEKPLFLLTIPKFDRYWQEAVDFEIDRLKKALGGYLILDGQGLK